MVVWFNDGEWTISAGWDVEGSQWCMIAVFPFGGDRVTVPVDFTTGTPDLAGHVLPWYVFQEMVRIALAFIPGYGWPLIPSQAARA